MDSSTCCSWWWWSFAPDGGKSTGFLSFAIGPRPISVGALRLLPPTTALYTSPLRIHSWPAPSSPAISRTISAIAPYRLCSIIPATTWFSFEISSW